MAILPIGTVGFNLQNKVNSNKQAINFQSMPKYNNILAQDTVSFGSMKDMDVAAATTKTFNTVRDFFSLVNPFSPKYEGLQEELKTLEQKALVINKEIKENLLSLIDEAVITGKTRLDTSKEPTKLLAYRQIDNNKEYVFFEHFTPQYQLLGSLSLDPVEGTFILKSYDSAVHNVRRKIKHIDRLPTVSVERYSGKLMHPSELLEAEEREMIQQK